MRELSASWCSCNHMTGLEDRTEFAFPVSFSRSNNGLLVFRCQENSDDNSQEVPIARDH
jgi:hypothetical protein